MNSEPLTDQNLCSVMFELMRTERMHKVVIDDRMSILGLHRGQHGILREIEHMEQRPEAKALSQKDIAERFGISAPAVAMTVKKMEADGLILRKMSKTDNRYNELHLTERGRELLEQSREIFRSTDHAIYAGLSREELSCMLRCLYKMQKNLSAMPETHGHPEIKPMFED